jgi:hypothetical protein
MKIDLHGYRPAEIVFNGVLGEILQQTWEMGEIELTLIHGHGRNRGITPGFVNTNTGYFGLSIRRGLRQDPVVSPVDQAYDARLSTDGLYLNQTETKLKSDEKTIGLTTGFRKPTSSARDKPFPEI